MKTDWDEAKRAANVQKHGVDFSAVESFDWDTAIVVTDDRRDYGETRYRALGMIGTRLHALAFTYRAQALRVISLRKANDREQESWQKN